jgi:hypothetical protein
MRIVLANPPGYDESREKFYIKGGSRWSFRYDKTPTPEEKLDYCTYLFPSLKIPKITLTQEMDR